jgi:hypothetical protein
MSEHNILGVLRAQAWERAKGELRSILVSYINDTDRFEAMDNAVDVFIKLVEDNGWAE